ncbi:alpha/beta hydrolase [Methanoculleus sp. FWC-SCC1]|uniref:Alpha/beta hydrolase n=1 Tax=Methanoculleus frigidifontis TaxID=2584085 RepID=A0ABT8M8H7_9EURY|nr:alpha/beta hydrolase [Methanoculleus sp. FWC-SCC1]MDN7024237.1 alpha/beta hydrolase [Methanoculleus sp. FWC-SCC1]
MPHINIGTENSGDISLYYEDHGTGRPVVLIHGWPLSGLSWEKQVPVLLDAGHRVVTYDRRGFGQSGRPAFGYDYDTLAGDLHKLVTELNLRNVTLVGFSMGGGEVARYLGTYGSERAERVVFISSVPPFLQKAPDNPDGVDAALFDAIRVSIVDDRPMFLSGFLSDFYNVDVLGADGASDEVVRLSWNIAAGASPIGTLNCVTAFAATDFRGDLGRIDVPVLIVHGDADRIVPFAASGKRTHEQIPGSRLAVIEGGPHGILWTHAGRVNRELLEFLGKKVEAAPAPA